MLNDISIRCRCCGVACHIGLDTGLPTIGVAKNLHQIQEFGPQFNRDNVKERFEQLSCPGEYIELATDKVRNKKQIILPSQQDPSHGDCCFSFAGACAWCRNED